MSEVEMDDYIDYMNLAEEGLTPSGGDFELVNIGEYDFEITEAEQAQSKKGHPVLVITSKVIAAFAEENASEIGKTIRSWFSLRGDVDFARRRLLNLLNATQTPIDSRGGFSRKKLVGAKYHAKVASNDYEDIDRDTGEKIQKSGRKVANETVIQADDA